MSLRMPPVYTPHDHGVMIADRIRVGAYRRALERVVKPGDIVVDIGTGTGLFALFACQLGARQVYAIEAEEVIDLAREIAQRNGCADRIEFIRAHSMSVDLPERADVIVSDIHGVLPPFERGLDSLRDARRRFMKEGATLIPRRDRLWTAAAELPDADYARVAVWSDGRWGVDLTPGARFGTDSAFTAATELAHLRTEPACLASIDYTQLDSPTVGGVATLTVTLDGFANGYALWFDTELADGVWITSAPGEETTVYSRMFVPWTRPVALRAGDAIQADFRFALVNGDYVWRWNTRVGSRDATPREQFQQSSLNSMFTTTEPLRKRAPSYRPHLTEHGEAERAILHLMDGGLTLAEIARDVARRFPRVFPGEADALKAAADLSEEFGGS